MLYHVGDHSMIDLSDIQAEILKTFLDYERKTEGNISKGLTSGAVAKRGLNRRTFEINIDFLLAHHLLKITKEEKHGTQTCKYYDLTPLGVIAFLKWNGQQKPRKNFVLSNRFFPHITKYKKQLEELFTKKGLQIILERTTEQIDLNPLQIIKDKNGKEISRTSWHNERMQLLLVSGSALEISVFNNYKLTEHEMDFITKNGVHKAKHVDTDFKSMMDEKVS